ncbi:MAG: LamG domain-containing protein [Candidatus Nitrosoabyssus spongiisocia]|nr:MAG: LamG domain-containing protein [Nitrosopumilaceae archaeon AB1(1)]
MASSLFYNTDFTISAWANIDVFKLSSRFVDFGNGHEQDNIIFTHLRQIDRLRYQIHNADNVQSLTTPRILSLGQWAYLTVVHESSGTATIYHNGTSVVSALLTPNDVNRTSNYIGRANNPAHHYFDGKFDEFRLSSTARSADWIATEYANQNSPSTFFTISAPEDRRVVISFAITNTQGDNIIITFNENITYSVIPTTDFTLTGTSATIDSITSNSSSITLNLSGNLLANEIITISYTKTSGGINSTQSTDITLENFVNQPITNNVLPPPIFVSAYTNQQGDIITVNFDKGITLTNTTSPTDFAVNILGIDTTSITRHNDTAINLTLDSSISLTSSLTLSYNQTTSNITNVNDLSLANFTNQPITNNVPFFDLPSLWNTRQKITINSNQITTTLQNFTLLVSISDSALSNSVCST